MEFSTAPVIVMHVDINSCFATIEQQANPRLRGKPTVVAAYVENHGCILAASYEAKRLGIKTGMRVGEAKNIYKNLVVLSPDPEKYRVVNKKMRVILESYTPFVSVESIDEMVLSVPNTLPVAKEIKQRIKNEIGEWITVSVGIAPNRYLAKIASNLHKPDGLDIITGKNIEKIFGTLRLEDLTGIKEGNATRLRAAHITTPIAMLSAGSRDLERAFRSIVGYHWWKRLHGYEEEIRSDVQKSFGQSFTLGKPYSPTDPTLWQILSQLVMKMGRRLRKDNFTASGMSVSLLYADHTHWGLQHKTSLKLFADIDFYYQARNLLLQAPKRPVRILAVSCFDLSSDLYAQQSLFSEENRKEVITQAIDSVQDRFGEFSISSGRMLAMDEKVLDRIAFGKV